MVRNNDGTYSIPNNYTIDIGDYNYPMQGFLAIKELAKGVGGDAEFVYKDTEGNSTEMGDFWTVSVKGDFSKVLDEAIGEQDKKQFMIVVPVSGLARKEPYSSEVINQKWDEGWFDHIKTLSCDLSLHWAENYTVRCLIDYHMRGGVNERITAAADDNRNYSGDAYFVGYAYDDDGLCGIPEYIADKLLKILNSINVTDRKRQRCVDMCYDSVKGAYSILAWFKKKEEYDTLTQTVRDEIGTAFGNLEAALCNIDQERATKDLGIND